MSIRYELQLWLIHLIKLIPGRIGCWLRLLILPIKHGTNVRIWEFSHIDSPSNLECGNNVSINRGAVINAAGYVVIGNDVLIGPNVTIYSQNHNFDRLDIPFVDQGYSLAKVVIGNNVWLAANVVVLPGVEICSDVVVAAGSIVAKSIHKSGLYAGTPAKLLRTFQQKDGTDEG